MDPEAGKSAQDKADRVDRERSLFRRAIAARSVLGSMAQARSAEELGGIDNVVRDIAEQVEEKERKKEERREKRGANKSVVKEATGAKKLKYRNKNPLLPQHPSRLCIAGGTGTGKSFWLIDLLEHPDMPYDRVIWIAPKFSLEQPILQALKKKMGKKLELVEGDTTAGLSGENQRRVEELIDGGFTDKKFGKLGMQQLVVLDDLMNVGRDRFFTDLFVSGRHRNVSVAELSQRIFLPGKGNRTRRLNCEYFVLFHFSSMSEPSNLFKQLDPQNFHEVLSAYKRSIIGKPVGSYFMVDLMSPRAVDASKRMLKYRNSSLTRVFPELSRMS